MELLLELRMEHQLDSLSVGSSGIHLDWALELPLESCSDSLTALWWDSSSDLPSVQRSGPSMVHKMVD